jgi:hypothetical protein
MKSLHGPGGASAGDTELRSQAADGAAQAGEAGRCPGKGSAVALDCPGWEAKLVSAAFYRQIGAGRMVSAGEGEVFCLLELEWVVPGQGTAACGLSASLLSGRGDRFEPDPAGLEAFLAMQPEGRFLPAAGAREGRAELKLPAATAGASALVFRLPAPAAREGLYLELQGGCPAGTAAPAAAVRFCLGRYNIQ